MPPVTPSDGAVAVTGASGFIGSHVVLSLLKRGYEVRACVTDPGNPVKRDPLLAMNGAGHPGRVTLHKANLLEPGSYDEPFAGCRALLHVGTAMGYGGANKPQQVYDGAVGGTANVMKSVQKAGTVRRFVYTSSFAAIGHPAPSGYVFTEKDWASDNRENDPDWNLENLDDKGETGYAMAKVETEHMTARIAEEDGGFEAISICPVVVLGPLLSTAHESVFSWQWFLGRMLRGKDCGRGWQHLWNIVDVRDVAEAPTATRRARTWGSRRTRSRTRCARPAGRCSTWASWTPSSSRGWLAGGSDLMHTELEGRAPGEETPDTAARYVGFWARFLAFVVDSAWVGVSIGLVLAAA